MCEVDYRVSYLLIIVFSLFFNTFFIMNNFFFFDWHVLCTFKIFLYVHILEPLSIISVIFQLASAAPEFD